MNNRIKEVRKSVGLNQDLFGKRIGVSRDTIANIESGRIEIKDIFINSICREFSVSDVWLRTGQGEMRKEKSKDEEILEFLSEIINDVDDSIKKRIISALIKLDSKDWEAIARIADKLEKK